MKGGSRWTGGFGRIGAVGHMQSSRLGKEFEANNEEGGTIVTLRLESICIVVRLTKRDLQNSLSAPLPWERASSQAL